MPTSINAKLWINFIMLIIAISLAVNSIDMIRKEKRSSQDEVQESIRNLYTLWKKDFGMLFSTPEENEYRLRVFYEQKMKIDRMNQVYETASMKSRGVGLKEPMFEINMFAGLTDEEFKAKYSNRKETRLNFSSEFQENTNEDHILFSQKVEQPMGRNLKGGYEIRVREQGGCGSCWAFSAVASLEKFYYDKTGQRLDFSVQEMVDCNKQSLGCEGGRPELGFLYVKTQGGLSMSSSYPYIASKGACLNDKYEKVPLKLETDGEHVPYTLERARSYYSKGYHSAINVYGSGMLRYLSRSSDVMEASYTDDCDSENDHSVNIIEVEGNVVTLLNTWGPRWGNKGTKRIIGCTDTSLYGIQGRIAHPGLRED